MLEPGLPAEEQERLKALQMLSILDTAPEERFDRITRMAQHVFDVPISLVSLVDAERQWFKSRQGIDATQTPRSVSFCGHAILGDETFVVEDAHEDARFADNPLVTAEPHVRFYAGHPLATPEGHRIGTLCIVDHQPRALTAEQVQVLKDLGGMVETELRMQEMQRLRGELDAIVAQKRKLELDQRLHWDHSLDLLCIFDFEGNTVQINPAWTEVTGYDGEEILARNMASFVHRDDREREMASVRELFGSSGSHTFEARLRCRDGSHRWVLWKAVASKEDQRIFAIGHDITERKTMERKLAESNHELEHFASVASHDLQEPLRKILAFGDRLESHSGAALDERGKDYLTRMRGAASRMSDLISALLTYSRVGTRAAPHEPVDLGELTQSILGDLEVRVEESGAKVAVDPLPVVNADPTQMRQLLQNLLGNALKFSRPDVTPEIRVWPETTAPSPDTGPSVVRIHVEDNGIGFEPRFAERIFDVFQRLHGRQEYEGTGVGLSICRRIAERHGGSIEVQSEPGVGSRFTLVLPANAMVEVESHVSV